MLIHVPAIVDSPLTILQYRDYFVRSYGWYDTKDFLYITMEYLPLGDLSRYLKDPIPEAQAASISLQVLEGLRFMHQNNVAHRDLKPNVSHSFVKSETKHHLIQALESSCAARRSVLVG